MFQWIGLSIQKHYETLALFSILTNDTWLLSVNNDINRCAVVVVTADFSIFRIDCYNTFLFIAYIRDRCLFWSTVSEAWDVSTCCWR